MTNLLGIPRYNTENDQCIIGREKKLSPVPWRKLGEYIKTCPSSIEKRYLQEQLVLNEFLGALIIIYKIDFDTRQITHIHIVDSESS